MNSEIIAPISDHVESRRGRERHERPNDRERDHVVRPGTLICPVIFTVWEGVAGSATGVEAWNVSRDIHGTGRAARATRMQKREMGER